MGARIISFFLVCTLVVILSACDGRFDGSSGVNVLALADQQRHRVIDQTRASSYSVFPDTDDAEKLKDPTFLDAMHAESPNGSAFVIREDGLVTTNMHVIRSTNFCTGEENTQPKDPEDAAREMGREQEASAREEGKKDTFCLLVTQAFTKAYRAKLIKIDEKNDSALLCLEQLNGSVPFLPLAAPRSFHEGAEVLTIGSPLGNMNMMTPGFISNLNFVPEDRTTGQKGAPKIQFSAPILPGNSGGPLVSVATGGVVGQVVAVIVKGNIPTQMSFANPVSVLQENMRDVLPCDKKAN
jgi:S1-C subfamily serine protease